MSTTQWNPTSEEEKTLKDAVTLLQTSIKGAVPNVDNPDVPSRFVLNSKGYFDLRAYVMSGKRLPRSNDYFKSEIPENAFTELTAFDPEIYERTKRTMVGVGQSCGEYYDNQLTRLVNAAAAAIQYADNTTEMLTVAEGMNLKHHLDILLQEKYKYKADQDAAFDESREAALATISMLKDDADSKKKDVDDIVAKLLTMKTTTMALQPEVEFLTRQFKTGPVDNKATDSAKKKPYLDQLNAAYNSKLEEIKLKLKEARETNAEWETKTGLAAGFSFWPGVGWIVMGVMAAQAKALKDAFDELNRQIDDMKKKNQEKMSLITKVGMLIEQCQDVDSKMTAAIEAMKELSDLFLNQSTCYDKIAFYINGMSKGVRMDSHTTRKVYVTNCLNKTVEWLKDLKKTAEEFQKNIVREVKM